MDETLTRQIKIYCPEHQTVFEMDENPKIICEIRDHALSNDFPRAEFWEYCCDCQTFSPSKLETGGKVSDVCRHCERATLNRFVCDECKIVSFDSGEDTKDKHFSVNQEKGVEPNGPGCHKIFGGAKPQLHNCSDVEGALLTYRKECPFCRKSTAGKPPREEFVEEETTLQPKSNTASTQCPQ